MNDREASIFCPSHDKPRRININNSLSTLDPVHYEVMNTPTRPVTSELRGGRVLDMRHVILWQREQAQSQGELGLTMNFPDPSEMSRALNTDADSDVPADDRATLVAAMQETHKSFVQLHQRKVLMDQAGPLLASTEMNVNQKLIAAGVPEHEFQYKSLNQKIVQLVELEEPPPKENFVVALIEVASSTKGRNHLLEVNLPLKACMAEVYGLLNEVVKALLAEKGLSYERGGAWKYQLIDQSRSQLLLGKSSPLETDLHYKVMLQQASKVGDARAPLPVLTQVCLYPEGDVSLRESHAYGHGNRAVLQRP